MSDVLRCFVSISGLFTVSLLYFALARYIPFKQHLIVSARVWLISCSLPQTNQLYITEMQQNKILKISGFFGEVWNDLERHLNFK
jgi:uncharacterized membrane protein